MSLKLNLFARPEAPSHYCVANVGNGIACGRESVAGESLCSFHRTLNGPWFKAATKKAA
jgi:hypothetical protein